MRTQLLTVAILAVSLTVSPQGKVTFGNDSTRLFVLGPVVRWEDSPGLIQAGPLASGVSIFALLYAGTSASSLTLQTTVVLTGANLPSPGRMVNKPVTLTIPGGVAQTFQIVLCGDDATVPNNLAGLATWTHFYPGGFGYFGTSGLFTAVPGTSLIYPFLYQTTSPVNSTWAAGNIPVSGPWPEPSVLSLVSVGLLVFWVRTRCVVGSLQIRRRRMPSDTLS